MKRKILPVLAGLMFAIFVTLPAFAEPARIKGFVFENGKNRQVVKAGASAAKISVDFSKKVKIRAKISGGKASVSYFLTPQGGAPHTGKKVDPAWVSNAGKYRLAATLAAGKSHRAARGVDITFTLTSAGVGSSSRPPTRSVAIPLLAQWQQQMTQYGAIHCQTLENQSGDFDTLLAATYYDAEWVYYQIGDYTHDSRWYDCAQAAEKIYGISYVIANKGNIPGYWDFTHGLTRDYLSTGDTQSKAAALLLSHTAAYASDSTPASSTVDAAYSRETAYAIMAYLNAEDLGDGHRSRTELLVNQALGHLNQWFVSKSAPYVRPFMFSLTAHALISYDERYGNSKILPALTQGANWIWDNMWLPASNTFEYTDRATDTGGTEPAPDLNLLIAPVYAWIWHKTGDPVFRDRADQIFAGGVTAAYIHNAKQFNQNYRWSFAYIKWRSEEPER